MTSAFRIVFAALSLFAATESAPAQELVRLQRQDGNALALMAYAPNGAACRGIVLVSPGAGGSERGYRYLGEALSSLGYLTVVMGHTESGPAALGEQVRASGGLRGGLAELISDPQAWRTRLMDIAASRQWAAGRCDSRTAILIGHSMGAATAMMEAGARNQFGIQGADSFTAYIALSPQGVGPVFPGNAWSNILKPVLLLTGTRDNGLDGTSWENRTLPFTNFPPGCKWLGVIDGATHLHFAGYGLSRKTEKLTVQTATSFIEGLDHGDCAIPASLPGIEMQKK